MCSYEDGDKEELEWFELEPLLLAAGGQVVAGAMHAVGPWQHQISRLGLASETEFLIAFCRVGTTAGGAFKAPVQQQHDFRADDNHEGEEGQAQCSALS